MNNRRSGKYRERFASATEEQSHKGDEWKERGGAGEQPSDLPTSLYSVGKIGKTSNCSKDRGKEGRRRGKFATLIVGRALELADTRTSMRGSVDSMLKGGRKRTLL